MEAGESTFAEEWLPEGVVLSIRGALDRGAVKGLHTRLDDLVRNGHGEVTVDLCATSCVGEPALQLLLVISRRLARQGRRFAIICPPGPSLSLIGVSGLQQLFTIYPSRHTAQRA